MAFQHRPRIIHTIRTCLAALLLMVTGLAIANVPPATKLQSRNLQPASKAVSAPSTARAAKPLHAVSGTAFGQTGYVHYFLLRLPDETLEIQVGIELDDQRIAWSFPGLGVTVSPFIDAGEIEAGGSIYEVWHLYGLRPFPDDAAMASLRRELPLRLNRWIKAGLPYCLDDGPRSNCISCLGFVLRALYPVRNGYPQIPADFSRTRISKQYTPNDLLLYLSGMLELPDRNARMQRLQRQTLPADLREDLEELIYGIGVAEKTVATVKQKRAAGSPRAIPAPRRL